MEKNEEDRLLSMIPPNFGQVKTKACANWCKHFRRMTICTGFGAPLEGMCKKYKLAGIVTEYTICDSYEE